MPQQQQKYSPTSATTAAGTTVAVALAVALVAMPALKAKTFCICLNCRNTPSAFCCCQFAGYLHCYYNTYTIHNNYIYTHTACVFFLCMPFAYFAAELGARKRGTILRHQRPPASIAGHLPTVGGHQQQS